MVTHAPPGACGDGRHGLVPRLAAIALWASAVVGGLFVLQAYESTAGSVTSPTKQWPVESALDRDPLRPTLLMFAHPKCPCTRASIDELNALLASCSEQLRAMVVFVRPSGVDQAWGESGLARRAAELPPVEVRFDEGGVEATLFGAATSGHVMLYDPTGRLLFSGGITVSRGHSGMSAGRIAIESLLLRGKAVRAGAPVYGCPLRAALGEACVEEGSCCTD